MAVEERLTRLCATVYCNVETINLGVGLSQYFLVLAHQDVDRIHLRWRKFKVVPNVPFWNEQRVSGRSRRVRTDGIR